MNLFRELVILPLLAAVGAYLGAYLKIKAEQRALSENFNTIVRQLRETTKATEEIKSRISGEYWLAQQRWKLRSDLFFAMAQSLGETKATTQKALNTLRSEGQAGFNKMIDSGKYSNDRAEAEMTKAMAAADLVSPKLGDALDKLVTQLAQASASQDDESLESMLEAELNMAVLIYDTVVGVGREDLLFLPQEPPPTVKP